MDASTQTGPYDGTQRVPEVSEAEDVEHAAPPSEEQRSGDTPIALPGLQNYQARRLYASMEGKCPHSTMSRIYQEIYRCDYCGEWPPCGWLYRCTMDRDPLIMGAKANGFKVAFDDLGANFSEDMNLGLFGPDARSAPNSFLNEITTEQMRSYTPQQLSTVLSQRENVRRTIAEQRAQPDFPRPNFVRRNYPDDNMPWMPNVRFECQHKICHRCHPIGRDKSWVSLDAVLNGDILPTVATGFAFSYMDSRPMANADVVKNIGYRAVPLVSIQAAFQHLTANLKKPRNHPARAPRAGDKTSVSYPPGLQPPPGFTKQPEVSTTAHQLNETGEETTTGPGISYLPGLTCTLIDGVPEAADKTSRSSSLSSQGSQSDGTQSEGTQTDDSANENSEHTGAHSTWLPVEDTEEVRFFPDDATLDGVEGVALTEEAAEDGTPDVVAYPTYTP